MKNLFFLWLIIIGLPSVCLADLSIYGPTATCPNTTVTYSFGNDDVKNESYSINVSQEGIIVEYRAESGQPVIVPASSNKRSISFSDTPDQQSGSCYVKIMWGNFRGSVGTINGSSFVPTHVPWRDPNQTASLSVQIGSPDITGTTTFAPENSTCDIKNIGFSIPAVAGATSYTWQNSFGWRLTGTMVSGGYSYGYFDSSISSATSGQVTVTAINKYCSSTNSTKTFLVTRGTGTHYIGGPTEIHGGGYVDYQGPEGCTNYNWSVPSLWAIEAGQGTDHIGVRVPNAYAQGNVSVTYTDICGQNQTGNIYVQGFYDQGPPSPGTQDMQANPEESRKVDSSVSIENKLTEQLRATGMAVYPNPAANELRINAVGVGKVSIYNGVGALVREASIAEGTVSTLINILGLPNGNYRVRLVQHGKPALDKQISIIH